MISRETSIEDLVRTVPGSVRYLMEQGIKCLACGEPIWGTVESAALEKGFSSDDIDAFVKDLNRLSSDSLTT